MDHCTCKSICKCFFTIDFIDYITYQVVLLFYYHVEVHKRSVLPKIFIDTKSLNTGLFVFHWICYVLLSLLKKRIVPSAIIWIHLKARYKILLMHLVLWRMFLQNIALELYLKFVSSWLRINIYSKSPFGKTRVKIMCTIWQFSTQRWG